MKTALLQYRWYVIAALLITAQAAILFSFGQPSICTCDYVKVWEGVVKSPGNSQHISDWYTFSHIPHGIIFYWILWLLFPRSSIGLRLALALGLEISWEILENTPWVIDRYREQALAQGYSGDSILNSVMDSVAMMAGFLMARRLPILFVLIAFLVMEIGVLYMIRDNLTLNIINLLYPFESIHQWQSAGSL